MRDQTSFGLGQTKKNLLAKQAMYQMLKEDVTQKKQAPSAIAWNRHGRDNQKWRMEGDQIISKLNGLVLEISRGRRQAGEDIALWPKHGKSNQAWKITYQ